MGNILRVQYNTFFLTTIFDWEFVPVYTVPLGQRFIEFCPYILWDGVILMNDNIRVCVCSTIYDYIHMDYKQKGTIKGKTVWKDESRWCGWILCSFQVFSLITFSKNIFVFNGLLQCTYTTYNYSIFVQHIL